MNYQGGGGNQEKIERVPVPQQQQQESAVQAAPLPAKPTSRGLLLLAVAAGLHPQTMHYLGIALRKHAYSGIAVVGAQERETEIKELKMEVYSLIGQLQQELVLSTHFLDEWDEEKLSAVVARASASGAGMTMSCVLCTPAYEPVGSGNADILSLERVELQESWARSVGFLHAVAKSAIPRLVEDRTRANESNVFLLMEAPATSPAGRLSQSACHTLMNQLRDAYSAEGFMVGHAGDVLIAEPQTHSAENEQPVRTELYAASEPQDFSAQESPTKLWNMWSLQNEIGG